MKLSDKDIELIERAILGQLTKSENTLFQTKLKDDNFAKEWNTQQAIQVVIENNARNQLKLKLNKLESAKMTASDQIQPKKFWLWIVLLTVFTIVTASIYYFQYQTIEPNDLYLSYFQPYPNEIDPITKSSSENSRSPYQYYEIGDYEAAISTFIPNLSNKNARWYYAQSMMAIGDMDQARDILTQFVREKDQTYTVHGMWYLALLNIKEGQIDEAKKQLIALKNTNHRVYRKKAEELLNKLDQK